MEKSKNSINVEGGFLFCGGWNFSKSVSLDSTFIREMRIEQNKTSYVFFFKFYLPLLCSMFAVIASGGAISVRASVTIPTENGAVQSVRFQLKG